MTQIYPILNIKASRCLIAKLKPDINDEFSTYNIDLHL